MADKPDDQPEQKDLSQNTESPVATQVRDTPATDFRDARNADLKAKQDSTHDPEALKLLGLPPEFKKFLDDMGKEQKGGGKEGAVGKDGKASAGKDDGIIVGPAKDSKGVSGKDDGIIVAPGKDGKGVSGKDDGIIVGPGKDGKEGSAKDAQADKGDQTVRTDPGAVGQEQKERGTKGGLGQTTDAYGEKRDGDKTADSKDRSLNADAQNQKSNDKFGEVVNQAQNGNKAAMGMLVGLATGAGDPKFKDAAKQELKDMVKSGGEVADDVRQAARQMAERGFRPNDLSERREANNLMRDLKAAAGEAPKDGSSDKSKTSAPDGKPATAETKDLLDKSSKTDKPQLDYFPLAAGLTVAQTPEKADAKSLSPREALREKAKAQSDADTIFKPGNSPETIKADERIKQVSEHPSTKEFLKEKGVEVKPDGSIVAERTTAKGKENIARDKAGNESYRLETHPDGSRSFQERDGNKWSSKDGKQWTSTDGAGNKLEWNGTIEIKNGNAIQTSETGKYKYTTQPDGTKTTENPDHSTVTEKKTEKGTETVGKDPEGKEGYTFKTNKDGSQEAHVKGSDDYWKSPDGKHWTAYDQNGKAQLDSKQQARTWEGTVQVKDGNLVQTRQDHYEFLHRPDGTRVDTGVSGADLNKLKDTLKDQQPSLDKEVKRLEQKMDEDRQYRRPTYEDSAKEYKQVKEAKDKVDKVVKALKDSHPGDEASQDAEKAKKAYDVYKDVKELNSLLKELKDSPNKALESLTKKLMPGTGLPDAKDLVLDTLIKSWDKALKVTDAFAEPKKQETDARVDKFVELYKSDKNSNDKVKEMSKQLEEARKQYDSQGEFKDFLDKLNKATDGNILYKEDKDQGLTVEQYHRWSSNDTLFNSQNFEKKQAERFEAAPLAPSSGSSTPEKPGGSSLIDALSDPGNFGKKKN